MQRRQSGFFFQVEEMLTHFVLYRQCGTKFNNVLVAKGNAVEVSFRSDDFGSGRGFNLTWSGRLPNGTCKIIKLLCYAVLDNYMYVFDHLQIKFVNIHNI